MDVDSLSGLQTIGRVDGGWGEIGIREVEASFGFMEVEGFSRLHTVGRVDGGCVENGICEIEAHLGILDLESVSIVIPFKVDEGWGEIGNCEVEARLGILDVEGLSGLQTLRHVDCGWVEFGSCVVEVVYVYEVLDDLDLGGMSATTVGFVAVVSIPCEGGRDWCLDVE
jgi:hypothetical protein